MPIPQFIAAPDRVPALEGEFLVCLGRPDNLPVRDPATTFIADAVTQDVIVALTRLDPRRMAQGLAVVTTAAEQAARPEAVLRAQKMLALLFVKYVFMPAQTTRVPDPLELRSPDTPPEYLHELNHLRNTPFFLRHVMADKLEKQRVGLPCMLLLPGPSLALLAPHLRELSRRHLMVTISRTLPFFRQHGVAPDILLQLDTMPIQEHFHHPGDRFPESVLLALSLAPIRSFATHFRRVFFIDSFNLSLLPNSFRLRESWLSSLLPCLGCAEALHAPRVLLAGADLRLRGEALYYNQPPTPDALDLPDHDTPLTSKPNHYLEFPDAAGKLAHTTLQYFATAAEAELFAGVIGASRGTTFGNLSPVSILDRTLFAPTAVEEALDAPVLDKSPFLAKVDAADAEKENISLLAMRAMYTAKLAAARREHDLVACTRLTDASKLDQHPYGRYIANLSWSRPSDADGQRDAAVNLAAELYEASRVAKNIVAMHLHASKKHPVAVLVTAAEEARARRELALWRPDWRWRFQGVEAPCYEEPMPSDGGIALASVGDWLRAQAVVLLGPDCAREFGYVLSLFSGENVVPLDAVLAYRTVAMEGNGESQTRFS
ncbi:6-hydroxymethylpterin diphosphokinase MptE-like protein [Solidesulfovibrio sp.]|uniref:6-hydroxymethylpterin diphosphokinase MptE-like protein n=1 Tax=Solidesulfovibrio sp. TaxID=2910990 RepID=UPI002B1EC4BF|nr:6-hydroxymethylpterin diphosphokinase MptE-like protein [Solidesulfovibrio sp.]MEA5089046.1 6-hydroxymethylpterin diphosphokinase MptE-like protein [Solidesulfovibrio sp.]